MNKVKNNNEKKIKLERFCHYNKCIQKDSGCPFNHFINEKEIYVNFKQNNINKNLCYYDKPWIKRRCTNIHCNKDHFYGREKWLKTKKKNLLDKVSLKSGNEKKSNLHSEVNVFLDNILLIIDESNDKVKSNDIVKTLKFIIKKLKILDQNNNNSYASFNYDLIEYLKNQNLLNNKDLKYINKHILYNKSNYKENFKVASYLTERI